MKGESNDRDLEVEGWADKPEAATIAVVIRYVLNKDLRIKKHLLVDGVNNGSGNFCDLTSPSGSLISCTVPDFF